MDVVNDEAYLPASTLKSGMRLVKNEAYVTSGDMELARHEAHTVPERVEGRGKEMSNSDVLTPARRERGTELGNSKKEGSHFSHQSKSMWESGCNGTTRHGDDKEQERHCHLERARKERYPR